MIPSLSIETLTRNITTHTAAGARTGPHAFVRLRIQTPNGRLLVTIDASEWSRILAFPGRDTPIDLAVDGDVTQSA